MGSTDIETIIELKRGIFRICWENLMEKISRTAGFTAFYRDVFQIYGLSFNNPTIRQKRNFVAAVTKYFILDRLPSRIIYIEDGKYEYEKGCQDIYDLLVGTIEKFNKIKDSSHSNQDFMKRYAEYHNEDIKDFSEVIAQNRDDSLSNFAKVIEKVYHSQDK